MDFIGSAAAYGFGGPILWWCYWEDRNESICAPVNKKDENHRRECSQARRLIALSYVSGAHLVVIGYVCLESAKDLKFSCLLR